MCGIFGVRSYKTDDNYPCIEQLVKSLGKYSSTRGKDATGIAYIEKSYRTDDKKPELRVKKDTVAGNGNFQYWMASDVKVCMGHTRYGTTGDKKKVENAHPFEGTCGGVKFALAHNGHISNVKELREKHSLPETPIETDTYVAAQLLEKQAAWGVDAIRAMAEAVEGSYTFTIIDEEGVIWFVKGDNPLYIMDMKDKQTIAYASTFEILLYSLADCYMYKNLLEAHFKGGKPDMVLHEPKRGEIWKMKPDGTFDQYTFKPKERDWSQQTTYYNRGFTRYDRDGDDFDNWVNRGFYDEASNKIVRWDAQKQQYVDVKTGEVAYKNQSKGTRKKSKKKLRQRELAEDATLMQMPVFKRAIAGGLERSALWACFRKKGEDFYDNTDLKWVAYQDLLVIVFKDKTLLVMDDGGVEVLRDGKFCYKTTLDSLMPPSTPTQVSEEDEEEADDNLEGFDSDEYDLYVRAILRNEGVDVEDLDEKSAWLCTHCGSPFSEYSTVFEDDVKCPQCGCYEVEPTDFDELYSWFISSYDGELIDMLVLEEKKLQTQQKLHEFKDIVDEATRDAGKNPADLAPCGCDWDACKTCLGRLGGKGERCIWLEEFDERLEQTQIDAVKLLMANATAKKVEAAVTGDDKGILSTFNMG